MLEQWDPRLHTLKSREPLIEANQVSVYSLSGTLIRNHDVDAGMRLMLAAPSGQLLQAWDGRGPISATTTMTCSVRWRCSNKRPTKSDPAVSNAWYMPPQHLSTVPLTAVAVWCAMPTRLAPRCSKAYGMTGRVLRQTRRFREAPGDVDWPLAQADQDQQLDGERYTTRWTFDALGGTLEQVDAKGNGRHFAYGLDGQTKHIHLALKSGARKTVIERYDYNAAGQVEAALLGNGVSSLAAYRAEDGRMHRLMAYRKMSGRRHYRI